MNIQQRDIVWALKGNLKIKCRKRGNRVVVLDFPSNKKEVVVLDLDMLCK